MAPDTQNRAAAPTDARGVDGRWSPATRQLARQLATGVGGNAHETARRLERDHGIRVSVSTVRHWIVTDTTPTHGPTARSLAERLILRLSSEIRTLERQGRLDLDRTTKVAGILKTLEPLTKTSKRGTLETLNDLQGSDDTEP